MSKKFAGNLQISRSKKIKELWNQQKTKFESAQNSVEKERIKSEIYDSIQSELGLSKKQRPMIRQTVNILLGYKPKPKTK